MREMIYTDGWGFNPIPDKIDVAMHRAHTDREVLIRQRLGLYPSCEL